MTGKDMLLLAAFGIASTTALIAFHGLGRFTQRYILRQKNPDPNETGVVAMGASIMIVIAIGVIWQLMGWH